MKQSFPAGFAALIHAGIVTHMVTNPTSTDATFAVARSQDLPEIRFAAAFDDGTLLLGCPNGLPKELSGIAEPIDPLAVEAESQTLAPTDLADKLDEVLTTLRARPDHAAQFEALQQSIATLAQAPEIKQRLEDLTKRIENPNTIIDRLADLESMIAANHTEFGTLADAVAHPRSSATANQLEAIQATLENLVAAQGGRDHPDLEAIKSTLGEMQTTLSAAALGPSPSIHQSLTQIDGSVGQVLAAVENLSDLPNRTHATLETAARIEAAVSAGSDAQGQISPEDTEILQTQLAELLSRPEPAPTDLTPILRAIELASDGTDLSDKLDRLDARLADMHPAEPFDPTPLVAVQNAVLEKVGGLPQLDGKMQALAAQVATLAKLRPATEPPATQAATALQSAMDDGLARIEAAIVPLSKAPENNTEVDTLILDTLSRIEAAIQHHQSSDRVDHALIENLEKAIQSVENCPPPSIDLTAQRQSFAQFTTALSFALNRLEVAVEHINAAATENQGTSDPVDLAKTVNALETSIASFGTTSEKEWKDLRADIDTIMRQPKLHIDMTAQQKSLAQFGTALATVLSRFDAIADQIELPRLGMATAEPPKIEPRNNEAPTENITDEIQPDTSLANSEEDTEDQVSDEPPKLAPPDIADPTAALDRPETSPTEPDEGFDPDTCVVANELRFKLAELIAQQIRTNSEQATSAATADTSDTG